MNRRRFFGLVGLTVAAAVVPWKFSPQIRQAAVSVAAARPVWLRGTYYNWERPGCPPC